MLLRLVKVFRQMLLDEDQLDTDCINSQKVKSKISQVCLIGTKALLYFVYE